MIPSGITFLSLLSGAAALWHFINGEISTGFYLIFVSIVLDVLDGYTARKLNACTHFGKMLDPIVDFIVYGPVLIAVLFRMYGFETEVFIVALVYTICHMRRVYPYLRGKKSLKKGLPDNVAAIVIALCYYSGCNLLYVYAVCGILMIAPFKLLPRMNETLTKAKARK